MPAGRDSWRPRRVLVGYDGTEGGHDAVALAAAIAEHDAEFVLVDVLAPPGIFPMQPRRLADEEPPQSEGFFLEALEQLRGRRVETRTYLASSAPHALGYLAEQESFDLIAIGPCYPGKFGRILVGSVGQGLMHEAASPILAAPRGYADRAHGGIGSIAVAYDCSPESREALAHAAALARRESATLRLLYVTPPQPGAGVRAGDFARPSAEEILSDALTAVALDLEVEAKPLSGDSVAGAIASECADDVDLLVVGSRGYGALGRVVIGSVAAGLLHRAACPLLVVPRPRADPDTPLSTCPPEDRRARPDGRRGPTGEHARS